MTLRFAKAAVGRIVPEDGADDDETSGQAADDADADRRHPNAAE